MSAHRRFLLDNRIEGQTEIEIEGEQFNHAKNVLRLNAGAEIVLLDGSGTEYTAIVTAVNKRSMSVHIVGSAQGEREAKTPVYLLCGALKGDKTELVVQKAVELGVSKIGVFNSKFCSAFMNGGAKLDRLNKVAREATKQCMRSVAPEVIYFDKFEDALASCEGYKNKLFACEFTDHSDVNMLELTGSSALVVGSEGGFSEDEFALAQNTYGFKGVTLGKRILRAETAAVSLTAIVMFLLGEME